MRIMRVLKIFSWIIEVNIIMKSISTSARCLAYVVFLMIAFFYHFGVAGVYLFSANDPFHFGNIGKALLTLFQVSTLDNWSGIARMNMYGCLHIGFDPLYCTPEHSHGWGWIAAWYFIVFVIVGVMVLVALFVGVIITSMELLQRSIREEAEMLTKVAAKQTEFDISDTCAHTLLEIFDMIDVCANGRLTLHELKPILGMVSLQESQQYELFHKIDEDMSGKIDFAEFVELMHLMKLAFTQKMAKTAEQQKSLSNLKGWLTSGGSAKGGMLSMLTKGFRPKKNLKSVAKMSIVMNRIQKSSRGQSFNNTQFSLSRVSEGSESGKSVKASSKGWNSLIEHVKSTNEDASVDLGVAATNPPNESSPCFQNSWFGEMASVSTDNQLDDVVAFKESGTDFATGSVVGPGRQCATTTDVIIASQTLAENNSGARPSSTVLMDPLANFRQSTIDFEIARNESDEILNEVAYFDIPGSDKCKLSSGGEFPKRMPTFNMDDIARSTPMTDSRNVIARPSTSGAQLMLQASSLATVGIVREFSPRIKYLSTDCVDKIDAKVVPATQRYGKLRQTFVKPPTSAEPNLFFSYVDASPSIQKDSLKKVHS